MNYSTETGPRLTEWAINKIKRDYPSDVALLVANGCSVAGDGHGECFAYFVPATERGYGLEREIHIGGVNHDLFPIDWARCERLASLDDGISFCLFECEVLYSRCPEDAAKFEALRQRLRDNLANPAYVYPKALEQLDKAMNLYRNMMFEEGPHQVRLAGGYVLHYLLMAMLYLNGRCQWPIHEGSLPLMAQCSVLPEHFAAYYQAMLSAKSAGELKSIAHLMIQTARKFIAGYQPKEEKEESSKDYQWLAAWYSEMSLTWRRLRFYCEAGNADAALQDGCMLQHECNIVAEEFGLSGLGFLGAFDSEHLAPLSKQATQVEEAIKAYVIQTHGLIPQYATFEEFAAENP